MQNEKLPRDPMLFSAEPPATGGESGATGRSVRVSGGSPAVDVASQEGLAWQLTRRGALRSCLRLAEGSARGRSADDLSDHLLPLAENVWRSAFGGETVMNSSIPPLPVGVLLEALRRDLLEEATIAGERLHTATLVSLLRAVDTVRERLDDDPSNRFISRFLGGAGIEALVEVAHDMRSPLSSIVLLAETLRLGQSGPVNEVQERQLALIYGATFGLSLMANDVIDLARGEERSREVVPIPFSVADVMQGVCEIVQPIAEEKKLELTVVAPGSDWRMGLPTPLHRVLLNLTTNALKFTDSGFVRMEAREIGRSAIEFSVIDSGRGIPAHLMGTLFDAFRQHHLDGKTTFSAAGLGLAICRKFVRSLGGELTAENLERGSAFRFSIELPVARKF